MGACTERHGQIHMWVLSQENHARRDHAAAYSQESSLEELLRSRHSGWFPDSFSLLGASGRASLATYGTRSSFGILQQLVPTCATVNAPFLPNYPQTCLVSPTLSHPIQPSLFKAAHRHRLYLLQSINAPSRHLFGTHEIWMVSFSTASYAFLEPSSFSSSFHGFKALYLLESSFFTSSRPVRACLYCPTRKRPRILVEETLGKTYILPLVGFLLKKKPTRVWS